MLIQWPNSLRLRPAGQDYRLPDLPVKIFTAVFAVLFIAGCDQVAYRTVGVVPEPAERSPAIEISAVATVTLAGPKDRVDRILHLIVERDPEVMTMVEKRELK